MTVELLFVLVSGVASLILACAAFYVAWRVRAQVVEPIELRSQVLAFDELLTEHTDRLRAAYARQRKRDKTLTAALAEATAPEAAGAPIGPSLVPEPAPEDVKDQIRAQARQMGLRV